MNNDESVEHSHRQRQLQRLLDPVREQLDLEVKGWLDLSDSEDKANLAQALLALANHGGGYVVIGFVQLGGEWEPAPDRPDDLSAFNQDAVNGIVERYADPSFHCSVRYVVREVDNLPYPIVEVPGGHTVPIRAKRDGPNRTHVSKDTYYVRRPGPQSAPPQSGTEWNELIRRVIFNDHDRLLEQLRHILGPLFPVSQQSDTNKSGIPDLDIWVEESNERFDQLRAEKGSDLDPGNYEHGAWTVAYAIDKSTDQLSAANFLKILTAIEGKETGWPPWLTFTDDERKPKPYKGVVEVWLAKTGVLDPSGSDFWRAAPQGRMYLSRGYQEDADPASGPPGSFFDVHLPIWRVGEVLLHAQRLARVLASDTAEISARFTWNGLKGRELKAWANPAVFLPPGRVARQPEVSIDITFSASQVASDLPSIVATVCSPLFEVFDFFEAPMQMVEQQVNQLLKRR